jgi:hypothetical protein
MSDQPELNDSRPKAGTVIGILNIIFGGFGIVGALGGIAVFSISRSLITSFGGFSVYEYEMIAGTISTIMTVITIMYVISTVISVLGLVGGVGLMGNKPWSIVVSDTYAIATILLAFGTYFFIRSLFNILFSNPLLLAEIPTDDRFILDIIKRVIPGISAVFSIIFGSMYPVLILALLNRKNVCAFYASQKEVNA